MWLKNHYTTEAAWPGGKIVRGGAENDNCGAYDLTRFAVMPRWSFRPLYFADQRQRYFGVAAIFLPGITAVFVIWYFLSHIAAAILGMTLTLLTGIYSAKTLCTLVPLERFPGPVQKIILFFSLALSNPEH
jgi:hypothetical protein